MDLENRVERLREEVSVIKKENVDFVECGIMIWIGL